MSLYYEKKDGEKVDWDTKRFKERKEWIFRFRKLSLVDAGWNSEIAKTKQEAIKQAQERWNKDGVEVYDIFEDSFHVPSEKEYKSLLREWD